MNRKKAFGMIAFVMCILLVLSACSGGGTRGDDTTVENGSQTSAETTAEVTTENTPKEKLYTKVITYNISYQDGDEITSGYTGQTGNDYTVAKRQARLKSLVSYYSPDILCLQEVNTYWWKYLITDEDSLLNTAGFGYVGNVGCFNGKDGTGGKLEFYNLLFYSAERFELIDGGTFWLDSDTTKPSNEYTGTITNVQTDRERMCTYALLRDKKTGTQAVYASTHLCTTGSDAGKLRNTTEAKILIQELEKIANGSPVVFCGDMNMNENSSTYKRITETSGYNDARKKAIRKTDMYGTFPQWGKNSSWKTSNPIDHCFYQGLTAYQYRVLYDSFDADNNLSTDISKSGVNYDISDHFGLYIKFISP